MVDENQMLHAKPAAGLAHGDVERGGEDHIVFAWLIPGFDASCSDPRRVDQFFEFNDSASSGLNIRGIAPTPYSI